MSSANPTAEKLAGEADPRHAAPGLLSRLRDTPVFWRILSLALFCLLWEFGARASGNFAFPTFSATLAAFIEMCADGSLFWAYMRTLEPLIIGVTFSLLVGISTGVAMGLRRDVEWLSLPVFIVMQAAPMAALIPLVTFVYGIGLASKVVAVVMLALPVISMNSYKAVRNTSPSLVAMCKSFLGNRRQQIMKVILPEASPMIFAGVRLGVAEGFSGVVLAELLITPTGIGDLITYARSVGQFAHMYAVIVSIVAFAVVTVTLLQLLEAALFRPDKRRSK